MMIITYKNQLEQDARAAHTYAVGGHPVLYIDKNMKESKRPYNEPCRVMFKGRLFHIEDAKRVKAWYETLESMDGIYERLQSEGRYSDANIALAKQLHLREKLKEVGITYKFTKMHKK